MPCILPLQYHNRHLFIIPDVHMLISRPSSINICYSPSSHNKHCLRSCSRRNIYHCRTIQCAYLLRSRKEMGVYTTACRHTVIGAFTPISSQYHFVYSHYILTSTDPPNNACKYEIEASTCTSKPCKYTS